MLRLHGVSGGEASKSGCAQPEQRPSLLYQVGARSQSQYLTSSSTLACPWDSPMLNLLIFLSFPLGVFKTGSHCVASTRLNSLCRTAWHGTHRFLLASASSPGIRDVHHLAWLFSHLHTSPPLSLPSVSPPFLWYLTFEMMFNASAGGRTTGHFFCSQWY